MPPLPDEERLVTLFADIHYYFVAPNPRPLHHRFDKGCYVYLYRNISNSRGRIEVANNPGTSDQDAFNGYLETIHLQNSSKFPTLCTITVDDAAKPSSGPSPSPESAHEWRLPSTDPRDEGRFQYRIHTLDLYFWTLDDAMLFLDSARKVLGPGQMESDVASHVPPPHEGAMSPVVQQLENMAITDPAYHHAQQMASTSLHTTSPATSAVPVPPPPPPASTMMPQSPSPNFNQSKPQPQGDTETLKTDYTPLAYNPAAPAAPEPIKPRVDTPPPPDGAAGTGLVGAASEGDQVLPPPPPPPSSGFQPQYQQQNQNSYFQNQPLPSVQGQHDSAASSSLSFPGPPPQSTPPSQRTSHSYTSSTPISQSFAPPPSQLPPTSSQPYQPQGPQLPTSPPLSPTYQVLGTPNHYRPPVQHLQPQYPDYLQQVGHSPPPNQPGPFAPNLSHEYSQHNRDSYNAAPSGSNQYNIHSQVYQPTEAEMQVHPRKYSHHHSEPVPTPGGGSAGGGKLETRVDKIDKGVGRFLKKLEKRLG
ncbi:MAG: hypothetical protein M1834_006318 [Cirrosporium novae-zelandiae]|nr:MAG: hypothetical protein M1834_006318 [Cirrosporium novae-zelandiae]